MEIVVNGERVEIPVDTRTVENLLVHRNVEMPDMVSVQRNGAFVPREQFATTRLVAGDEIDFLYFMGGGGK